ncbi:hypothetical protein E2C01_048869 [Portunus trituberculatus]|uniref:Uncharacterized protein n=1 Tax=Portunus trituberculatus TaxID=210409 RepID=A0A5B7G473_PORTR|nr:hypothetical protein [Portunus trituberculatus]
MTRLMLGIDGGSIKLKTNGINILKLEMIVKMIRLERKK